MSSGPGLHPPRVVRRRPYATRDRCAFALLQRLLQRPDDVGVVMFLIQTENGRHTGAVIAQIVWRYVFWWRCSSVLKVKMQALIPVAEIIKATMSVTFLGICFYVPKIVFDINSFFTLLYLFPFFFVCFYMYWKLNYLSEVEKSALVDIYNKLLHKFYI